MIQVFAANFLKQECIEDFLAVARVLVEKTKTNDKGCINYELCKDLNDPLRFIMHEEWEDKDALDAHMKSEHFRELAPKFGEYTTKPSELTFLEPLF